MKLDMSLFQKSVEHKYLNELDSKLLDIKYREFLNYFGNLEIQENIRNLKEEEFQEGFIRELFVAIFNYTLKPNPGFNIVLEKKNVDDTKKADGAIIRNNHVIAVIELKSTSTVDLGTVEMQAFGYKNHHPQCLYVITSNFEKIRFYIQNAVEYLEFDLFNLTREQFSLLWLCLAVDTLINDLPFKIKESSILQEDGITKKLYADYSKFRKAIYNNLLKNNPETDKLLLFRKTQKLLDRFLFIFFAEDRLLVPPNSISQIIEKWKDDVDFGDGKPLYSMFKQYFHVLNIGRPKSGIRQEIFAYNGGLFEPDEILDNINIDDDILYEHTLILSQYDFETDVDVNILGHIFEHSLGEIENVQAEIRGEKTDSQKTRRKKDGIFYTPKYITKYIVENTVGKLCEGKRKELDIVDEEYAKGRKNRKKDTIRALDEKLIKYRDWLLTLTIIDPACGSGAFLNQALDFLIVEHSKIDDLRLQLLGGGIVFSDITTDILEKNIFGVDLNEESVDIAKLSLWLRTAQKGRKLNTLSNNIKCGNSLIDAHEVAGDKAFNWQKGFPEIFAKGGFDVVIGNPPYVDIKGLDKDIVKYIFKIYVSSNNRVNLYSTFIEKSISILKESGYFSFIIPSSLLTLESYKELRGLILDKNTIKNIVRLPNESFGGAAGEVKVDTIILTFEKGIIDNFEADILIYKGFNRISEIETYNTDIYFKFNCYKWKNENDNIFSINVNPKDLSIIKKCEIETIPLIECGDFCLGLTPYDKYKGHTQEQIKNRVFHANFQKDDTFRKLLAGNDIKRYFVSWNGEEWISYGAWLGAPREKRFFSSKRILVKQIIDWSDKRIWAALTEDELYNSQNAFNIIPKEGYRPEYLVALINSNLLSFYHRKKFLEEFKDRFQKILIKEAKEFPIKAISLQEQDAYLQKVNEITSKIVDFNFLVHKFCKYQLSSANIEKLTHKLEFWFELDFAEFIKELNNTFKKTSGEKLSKLDEMEWMEFFETKKAEAQSLKTEIGKTDKEIDQMVYNLYGLTDEEIKLIENS